MAKKKLLLALVLSLSFLFNLQALALEQDDIDMKRINQFIELSSQARIKNLLPENEAINFYIFVSFSLSETLLKQLLILSKNYKAVLVLRGLKNNSFKQSIEYITSLNPDENEGFIIDPELFNKYHIQKVPTYVLARNKICPNSSCIPSYDKLTGNVSPKYALEKFSQQGDLAKEAKIILEGNYAN